MEKAVVEDRNRNVSEEYPVLRYRTEVVEREKVSGRVGSSKFQASSSKFQASSKLGVGWSLAVVVKKYSAHHTKLRKYSVVRLKFGWSLVDNEQ